MEAWPRRPGNHVAPPIVAGAALPLAAPATRGHHRSHGVLAEAARPLLGDGESGPSLGAFPYSAAENFLVGAMRTATRWRGKKEEEEAGGDKIEMSKGAPPLYSFISQRRPTAGLHNSTQ